MACEVVAGLGLRPGRTNNGLMGQSNHLLRDPRVSDFAQQAALISGSLFNHGDPDLSFCDVLAADAIETESDEPSTVNVEEFTDLMLFPELQGVFEIEDFPVFQDFPMEPMGGVDGTLKPRETISSIATVADSNGEISPAESDASVEHFFNTFTDLTRFLDKFEEAGPSDFNDVATFIAESNEPFGNDAEPSGTAPMTTLPTPVGSETASNDEIRVHPTALTKTDDSEAPPTKRARTSHSKRSNASAEQKYRHRRDKNNVASQRSRATRKTREKSMAVKAKELEADNERLRKRIDELSVIAEEARKCLVESLSQK